MPRKTRAIAKQPQKAIATPESLMASVAGMGMETVTSQDMLIPLIKIIQKLSPELNKTDPRFVEGCEEGFILNTGTGDLFEEMLFCPVLYQKNWPEWAPRKDNAGIIQIHSDRSILKSCRQQEGEWVTPEGNTVVETATFYGWQLSEDSKPIACYIPMSKSQLRKARSWITMARAEEIIHDGQSITPPLFYRTYLLRTREQSNVQGSWHGWEIERADKFVDWCTENDRDFEEAVREARGMVSTIHESAAKYGLAAENVTEDDDSDEL